jgi:hypothetical protein
MFALGQTIGGRHDLVTGRYPLAVFFGSRVISPLAAVETGA